MLFKRAAVLNEAFEFEIADVMVENGVISAIGEIEGEGEDLSGKYLIPGLVDVHTHGAVGTDTMDKDFDFDKWQKFLFTNGVTTFYPSTASGYDADIMDCLTRLAENDKVEGINLEGPYINPDKKGAHLEGSIRRGTIEEFGKYMKASGNKIKLTTIAPEICGQIELIKEITDKYDTRVALGHTLATYDEATAGFNAGATQMTHTFNAMPPFLHREPGPVGAAIDDDRVFCEVISDGIHLHPSVVRMLYKALGSDRMVLISDSMAATGLPDGKYILAGSMDAEVKSGVARTLSGAIAGSTKNLMDMVKTAISFGIPAQEAVKMASYTAARSVNAENIGSISIGRDADLVVCHKDFTVFATYKKGKKVFG